MTKAKVHYECSACGAVSPKWSGQCQSCGQWNTLVEAAAIKTNAGSAVVDGYSVASKIHTLYELKPVREPRIPTGFGELDRVLGGGLVPGAVILLGGDPGIGKSTLLLQSIATLSKSLKTLYITGEESPHQIGLRAHRLGIPNAEIRLLSETCLENILFAVQSEQPHTLVVDSIQTIFTETLQSAPGAVAQVRESTARLVRYAKATDTALFIVGHVTKEGALAGPKVLEHMVDTVLYFEGDPTNRYRVIRAVKNRFGAVNEVGVFAMAESGLRAVNNPSAIFLSRHDEPVPGSVITVTREGTRPLLIELQALVDEGHPSNLRRITLGLEQNRLAMLLAVLHRHGQVAIYDHDVFVNVVGGVKVNETALDLAVLVASLSSYRNRPIPTDCVVFGEVGLAGEIRPVPHGEDRLREAAKHGFRRAILPKANAPKSNLEGLEIVPVRRLSEVLSFIQDST